MKEIELTKGKKALVDDDWYQVLSKFEWHSHHTNGKWYAVRTVGKKGRMVVFMHRYITMAPPERVVDHIDGDGLNNQESNLRAVRPKANYYNRAIQSNNKTGFKGVCWDKERKRYMASISHDHKAINLGRFNTAEEAAIAYNNAATRLYGDFARLNDV